MNKGGAARKQRRLGGCFVTGTVKKGHDTVAAGDSVAYVLNGKDRVTMRWLRYSALS